RMHDEWWEVETAIARRIKRLPATVDILAHPPDLAFHGEGDLGTDTVAFSSPDNAPRHLLQHEHPQPADVARNASEFGRVVIENVHRLGMRKREWHGKQAARFAAPGPRQAEFLDILDGGRIVRGQYHPGSTQ